MIITSKESLICLTWYFYYCKTHCYYVYIAIGLLLTILITIFELMTLSHYSVYHKSLCFHSLSMSYFIFYFFHVNCQSNSHFFSKLIKPRLIFNLLLNFYWFLTDEFYWPKILWTWHSKINLKIEKKNNI